MGKSKQKDIKTNVMRILDKAKIEYDTITYECSEFIDGINVAEKTGVAVELSYKTLVLEGKSKEYYVFVLPVAKEVDLKKAARAVNEKSVEMVHVKDITKVTGYVRGGCSPVGMKKQYKTVIDLSAEILPKIYISGGRIGSTVCLNPLELATLINAEFKDITE